MSPSIDAARLESGAYRAALIAAAAVGDAAPVRALAAGPPPPDVSPATKASFLSVALLRAAQGGHLEAVKALARVPDAREDASDAPRVDVSRANADGNTPLHMACERGDARCVDVLLALGANLAARNAEGKTPIAVARTGGIRAAVAAEVERRRDADASSSRQRTESEPLSSGHRPSSSDGFATTTPRRRRMTSSSAAEAPASPGSAVIQQKLKDDLKCVVCLRDFCTDGAGSAPVTLPCGHNFCAECVGGMRGTGDEDQRRAFRCPLDRTMFSRHLELRVNGAMRDLIGFMHSRVRGNGLSVETSGVVSTPQPRHKSRLGADAEEHERRRAAPAACGVAADYPSLNLRRGRGLGKENEDYADVTDSGGSRSPGTPGGGRRGFGARRSSPGGGSDPAARWGRGESPSPRPRALR
jgi:hypothetical protein